MAMASAKAMHFGAGHVLLDTTMFMHLQLLPTVQLLCRYNVGGVMMMGTAAFGHVTSASTVLNTTCGTCGD